MRYAILLYDDPEGATAPPAGAVALLHAERLLPARAATCVGGPGPGIQPGPCTAGLHVDALYVIESAHLDDAIAWADGLALRGGRAEIRPCVEQLSIPRAPARLSPDPAEEDRCTT